MSPGVASQIGFPHRSAIAICSRRRRGCVPARQVSDTASVRKDERTGGGVRSGTRKTLLSDRPLKRSHRLQFAPSRELITARRATGDSATGDRRQATVRLATRNGSPTVARGQHDSAAGFVRRRDEIPQSAVQPSRPEYRLYVSMYLCICINLSIPS